VFTGQYVDRSLHGYWIIHWTNWQTRPACKPGNKVAVWSFCILKRQFSESLSQYSNNIWSYIIKDAVFVLFWYLNSWIVYLNTIRYTFPLVTWLNHIHKTVHYILSKCIVSQLSASNDCCAVEARTKTRCGKLLTWQVDMCCHHRTWPCQRQLCMPTGVTGLI